MSAGLIRVFSANRNSEGCELCDDLIEQSTQKSTSRSIDFVHEDAPRWSRRIGGGWLDGADRFSGCAVSHIDGTILKGRTLGQRVETLDEITRDLFLDWRRLTDSGTVFEARFRYLQPFGRR